MLPGGVGPTGPIWRGAAVVAGGAVLVTVAGLAWSLLRVGALRPTYVREAQFIAGLGILAAWTLRNRRGRPDQGGAAGGHPAEPAGAGSLGGGSGAPGGASRLDPYLLGLGLLLLALSLGGELLGGPVG